MPVKLTIIQKRFLIKLCAYAMQAKACNSRSKAFKRLTKIGGLRPYDLFPVIMQNLKNLYVKLQCPGINLNGK